ncbi:uncharacterized protein LOC124402280 isoform X4 [Silurus meridionalis]|uniref:uncharacterized protein LOC124402280 isoform X4 n=1 Tax=Silurus meridionalis TaxID=175797 RepID=UPI001EEB1BCE|nr:uncharacterized protein LOC124402280 isoform X4 [Silurus meridionalis]
MPGLKVCYCRDHSLQRCFHMRSWWDVNTDSQDLRKLPSNLCHLLYRCKKFMMESLTFQKSISRPLFQCCVCVERYVAVIHPVIFLKYKPLRYRITCA